MSTWSSRPERSPRGSLQGFRGLYSEGWNVSITECIDVNDLRESRQLFNSLPLQLLSSLVINTPNMIKGWTLDKPTKVKPVEKSFPKTDPVQCTTSGLVKGNCPSKAQWDLRGRNREQEPRAPKRWLQNPRQVGDFR